MDSKTLHGVLNDLITLNKDRIIGYKEALHALKQKQLAELFREMIHQSEAHNKELEQRIKETGGEPEDKTTTSGLVYNTWMDIVYNESPEPPGEIYDYCRQMEETTLKGYEAALDRIGEKEQKDFILVSGQKQSLENSLVLLKKVKVIS